MLFAGHSDSVLTLAGNAILLVVTAVGSFLQRRVAWFLLLAWVLLEFSASLIEVLISFGYVALPDAAPWIEVRSNLWLFAKVFLLVGLFVLALRRRP